MKRIFFLFITLAFISTSCLKTKMCNVTITDNDAAWFPYSDDDTLIFSNQAGDEKIYTFEQRTEYADDEISDGATCHAESSQYVITNYSSNNQAYIGKYSIYKFADGDSIKTQVTIIFEGAGLVMFDANSDKLYNSNTGHELITLDSITINDSTYYNIYTLPATDTSGFFPMTNAKNIYLTQNKEIIRFETYEPSDVFSLIP